MPSDVELVLVEIGIDEGKIRDAVGDEVDLVGGYAVDMLEFLATALAHHDEARGERGDFLQHAALLRVGFVEHGVERGDDGNAQVA